MVGLTLLLIFAFLPKSGYAQEATRTVRVGIYQNKPKLYIDENGLPGGFFVEILQQIAQQEGWTVQYVSCQWSECLTDLADGHIDLMPDVAFSPEREEQFDFHQTPVIESWSQVYAQPRSTVVSLRDLAGRRVAVLSNSLQQTYLERTMRGFGFAITIVPVATLEQAFALASQGDVDAAVVEHLFGDYYDQDYGLVKTPVVFNLVNLYFATAKGRNAELLVAIDFYLDAWRNTPRSPYYMTLERWDEKPPVTAVPNYVRWVITISLGLLFVAGFVILLLRRQVQARTKHLAEANAALQESEHRYQLISTVTSDYMFSTHVDDDGNLTLNWVAGAFEAITGYTPDEYRARGGWRAAVHPDDLVIDDRDMEKLRDNLSIVTEIRTLTKRGHTLWVRVYAQPVVDDEHQKLVGIYGAVQDITERKEAEAKVRQLNQELERRVAERTMQLEAANKELEAFSYSVSHDLRAPLRAISGFSEIIARRHRANLNEEGRHYVDNIVQASAQMARLIDDLLTYSRMGRNGVRTVSVPLTDLLDEIIANMQVYLAQLQGVITVADSLPAVKGDETLLRQIFTNLLENAVTYHTPDAPPHVRVTYLDKGDQVIVAVNDNGIGIAAEHHTKIFNIFQRLHSNDEYPGTGIGLATVKKAVSLLGGAVWVESIVGEGSIFFVQLPKG
jgi:PAS domain S-box-containing protein